jgi:hypothetical protein
VVVFDISIWEELRDVVQPQIHRLVMELQHGGGRDYSLAEFREKGPIRWQFLEIMNQRASDWVQKVYDLNSSARKAAGKDVTQEFNRAVWAFCIEPFILGSKDDTDILNATEKGLLRLLLCAVGSPPERRRELRVSQKDCCLQVRRRVFESWRSKLIGIPSSLEEAAAVLSRHEALERRAMRVARGLPADDPPLPSTQQYGVPSVQEPSVPMPASPPEVHAGPSPLPQQAPALTNSEIASEPGQPDERSTESRFAEAFTWDSVQIVFLSDERVQILCPTGSETRNYQEFGFADGRNERPNRAWETFRELAEQNGVIREAKGGPLNWPKVEKRIQEIRRVLREHFGISADPIPFVEHVGYQASFRVRCSPSFQT